MKTLIAKYSTYLSKHSVFVALFILTLLIPSQIEAIEISTSVQNAYDVAGKVIITFEITYNPNITEIDYVKSDVSKYHVPDFKRYSFLKSDFEKKIFGEKKLHKPEIITNDEIVYKKKKKDENISERISYTFQVFEIEDVYILPMSIYYKKGNRIFEYKTPTITIFIKDLVNKSIDKDKISLKGIKSQFKMNTQNTMLILLISAGGLIVLAFGLIVLILIYKKRKNALENDKTTVRKTLDKLYDLQSSLLLSEGKIKEFYIRLSDIIRHFLAEQLELDIMENPTTEVKIMLSAKVFDEKHYSNLVYLLEQCDFVKYATYIPDKANIENDLLKSFEVVYAFEAHY